MDGLGNVIEQAWGGYTDTWEHDAAGRLTVERLAGKPEQTIRYEEGLASLVTYGAAPLPEQTQHRYWASGKLHSTVTPDGREQRLFWDGRGLVAREEQGSGTDYDLRRYAYDAAGRRASMVVGSGADEASWTYENGPRGELLSVAQPDGKGTFRYGYGERGELVSITPPSDGVGIGGGSSGAAAQAFEQDYLGRQVLRRRGDASWTTSWTSGAATTVEPADGQITRTSYRALDGRGREAVVSWSGVASDLTRVEREYGPHDGPLLARETRAGGDVQVAYTYGDPRLLLTQLQRGGESISYGYTASGERAWETAPSGRVDYRYDGLDRLQYVDSIRGTTALTWETGGGRLLDVVGPTVTECRRYDARGRVRLVASVYTGDPCETTESPLARFEYGHDERGNRLSELYQRAGQSAESTYYGYDKADRLVSVLHPSGAETRYGLGGDGSRLSETQAIAQGASGATDTYHYDPRGGLTSITDGLGQTVAAFTVDPAGRVKSEARGEAAKSFTWDAGGRLTAISVVTPPVEGSGSTAPLTVTSTHRYDHAGRRIEKEGPAGTTRYLWGDGELVEEIAPSGARMRYERMGGLAAALAGAMVLAAGGDTLLHDGLGSVVGRIGPSAPVSYRYDAWGSLRAGGPIVGEPSLAYAGQHWDGDAGLSYAQQRWYEPRVGRFLSEDPVFGDPVRPQTLNVFGYAGGNPTLYTDPEGLRRRLTTWLLTGGEKWDASSERIAYVTIGMRRHDTRFNSEAGYGGLVGVVRAFENTLLFGYDMGRGAFYADFKDSLFADTVLAFQKDGLKAIPSGIVHQVNAISQGDAVAAGELAFNAYASAESLANMDFRGMRGFLPPAPPAVLGGGGLALSTAGVTVPVVNGVPAAITGTSLMSSRGSPGGHTGTDAGTTDNQAGGTSPASAQRANSKVDAGANPPVTIGLGVDKDLARHKLSGAITYENGQWQRAGLTRVDSAKAALDPAAFRRSFHEAAANADNIRFDVTSFSPRYPKPSLTSWEFDQILCSEALLKKTTFVRNGENVLWDGTRFVEAVP